MTDERTLKLDEAALEAAKASVGIMADDPDRDLIAAYLLEAGFEEEKRGRMEHPKRDRISVYVDTERRLVSPWRPL